VFNDEELAFFGERFLEDGDVDHDAVGLGAASVDGLFPGLRGSISILCLLQRIVPMCAK
jgi:hypothetical protein